jgi:hypothetical protein
VIIRQERGALDDDDTHVLISRNDVPALIRKLEELFRRGA